MLTALISDLHLGTLAGADVASAPQVRARLLEALSGADRVVLLGDSLELRERPVAELLELARPLFAELGEVTAGRRLVLVPGNHDHALAEPWLTRMRLAGEELSAEGEWPVGADDGFAGRIAAWMPRTEVTLAYPGLHLRPDVYATHGHYLDLHLTVPRLESIAATAMGRLTGRGQACGSAEDYEVILGPMYAFYEGLAQGASARMLKRGGTVSRSVWRHANGDGRVGRLLLGRVTIPGAVAALNRLGLGPFRSDLSGEELCRSGLLALGRVAHALAPRATHVLFGHTHRPGPLAGDDPAEWTTPYGASLWNTGNWCYEPAFVGEDRDRSPYWPGTVTEIGDEGPPRTRNVLSGVPVTAPSL
jgi:predicted phosphodiesterase